MVTRISSGLEKNITKTPKNTPKYNKKVYSTNRINYVLGRET